LAKDADIAKALGTSVAGILGNTSATATIGSIINLGTGGAVKAAEAIWNWATDKGPAFDIEDGSFSPGFDIEDGSFSPGFDIEDI
jgi:hypothetical protein